MYGYIYLITDTTNGKRYVGQHKFDRYEIDSNYHGSGQIIRRINKHRQESMKMEYLMAVETRQEANFFEQYWIYRLNTLYPNGYNLSEGGDSNPMDNELVASRHREIMKSEEHKRKMRETHVDTSGERNGMYGKGYLISGERNGMYGKTHTEEYKRRLHDLMSGEGNPQYGRTGELATCYGRTGEKHPMFGKHHTEEAKERIKNSFIQKRIMNEKFVCPLVLFNLKTLKRFKGIKLENELLKLGIKTDYKYLQNESRIYNIKYRIG